VLASRGWTEEEFDRRERAQLPVEEKRRRSDYVLHNSGDRAEMAAAAAELLERITRDAQSADSQRLGSRRNKEDA
jgi:dephospho-CoA kinase